MILETKEYQIHIQSNNKSFNDLIDWDNYSRIIVICDENTEKLCLDRIDIPAPYSKIVIKPGESFKTLDTCKNIWESMIHSGADRKTLVINLGGGVIGDMGGFVASTYMRGIKFIQVPTSLLSQVDASVGGKLGVDFLRSKNIIGLFNNPELVYISPAFLSTLEFDELLSGYAEIIKHALISSPELWETIKSLKLDQVDNWQDIIYQAVKIKRDIVEEDPFEMGKRKVLNFGHSIGHAIESECLSDSSHLKHGFAVAAGMICESHVSYQKGILSKEALKEISDFIFSQYSRIQLPDYRKINDRMTFDKKNVAGKKLIASLDQIGHCIFDLPCSEHEVNTALDYYSNY